MDKALSSGPLQAKTLTRRDNRLGAVLDAAARCFCQRGYDAASMRDIAKDAGMKAGSLYYHFPSKSELLVAVHEEGIRKISTEVNKAIDFSGTAREHLQAAMIAHLESLLGGGDYGQVVIRELPELNAEQRKRLIALRDEYENIFKQLVDALPFKSTSQRHHLRLLLLGALNWTRTWYHPGEETPEHIARGFLDLIKET
jgi:AcrR family transcriptional regulator